MYAFVQLLSSFKVMLRVQASERHGNGGSLVKPQKLQ